MRFGSGVNQISVNPGELIVTANVRTLQTVVAKNFVGDGGLISNIYFSNVSIPPVLSADILGNLAGTKATLTGNATAAYFIGNGSLLTGIVVSNAWLPRTIAADLSGNVTGATLSGAHVGNLTGNNVTLIGNVSASYFIGNGSLLTGVLVANAGLPRTIAADLSGNVTGATLSGALVGNLTGNNVTLIGNVGASFVNATSVVAGNAVLAGGTTVANASGLFTAAVVNTGYVYSDTFIAGNLNSTVGYWRKSDGLLQTTAATIDGRLTVNGAGAEFTGSKYFLSNPPGAATWSAFAINANPISVVTSYGIYMAGGNFWASSDERRKFDIEEESPGECAAAVRAAKLVTYSTKEAPGRQLGFVAQQVANVVPGCVTLAEQAVPSVMRIANVTTPRSFVLEGASESLTGEHVVGVRLVRRPGSTIDANVASVSGDLVTLEDAALTGDDVFVYGPVVDDFNTLDYQRMWGTAFGAVQHLLSESDEKDERLAALEDRVSEIERRGWRRAATRAARGAATRLTACFSPTVVTS